MQCTFEEKVDLHNNGFRHSKCINKAEILSVNDICYGLCCRCAYKKLAERIKELEEQCMIMYPKPEKISMAVAVDDCDIIDKLPAREFTKEMRLKWGLVPKFIKPGIASKDIYDLCKRLDKAEAEIKRITKIANNRDCDSCGQKHDINIMCPPVEVRMHGDCWYHKAIKNQDKRIKELNILLTRAYEYLLNGSILQEEVEKVIGITK